VLREKLWTENSLSGKTVIWKWSYDTPRKAEQTHYLKSAL
jgi:hypothetical protein